MVRSARFNLFVPGLYVVREEIDGFVRFTSLRAITFGVVNGAVSGKSFIYVVDPWSGKPVEDVRITVRMRHKSVTRMSGPTGLMQVDDASPGRLIAERNEELQVVHFRAFDFDPKAEYAV